VIHSATILKIESKSPKGTKKAQRIIFGADHDDHQPETLLDFSSPGLTDYLTWLSINGKSGNVIATF